MILRDPRASTLDKEVGTVFYVFSLPELDECQKWAKELGMPSRVWDPKMKRLRVYGRWIPEALKLTKATMPQLRLWQETADVIKKPK